jgi:hypothetical protein
VSIVSYRRCYSLGYSGNEARLRRAVTYKIDEMPGGLKWIFMFPDAYRQPARRDQPCICIAVPLHVPLDFLCPEVGMRLGLGVVDGATMPEASVHKYCHLGSPEYEVSGSGNIWEWSSTDPVPQPDRVHGRAKSQLRLRIP